MKPQVTLRLPGLQNDSPWQVQEMDWAIPGGSHNAVISTLIKHPQQLSPEMIKDWLGNTLEIRSPAGEALWHGWIENIHLVLDRLTFRWGTQAVANRVIARFPQVSPLLNPLQPWGYSEWVQDAASCEHLGAKEQLLTLTQADANSARQAAANHMCHHVRDFQRGLVLSEARATPQLRLIARGWWQRLDWTLDSEDAGILAHLPGGKSQQAFGLNGNERLAQRFQVGAVDFQLGQISLRAALIGNPADQVRVKICTDSANRPGTVLASATLPNYALHGGWQWLTWQLDTALNLTAGTAAWLVVERTGGLDVVNHYALETDDGRGYPDGECRLWNGSDWVLMAQDLRFCLLAVAQSSDLIREVAGQAVSGGVLQGVQIWKDSGMLLTRWRALEKTRRAVLEEWLALGCADGSQLNALVNPAGILEVFALPRLPELPLMLRTDGSLCLPSGVPLPPALDLLGRPMLLPGAGSQDVVILRGLRWTEEEGVVPMVE